MKTISRLSKMTKHSILKSHTVNDMLLVVTKKINRQTDKQSNKKFKKKLHCFTAIMQQTSLLTQGILGSHYIKT